MYTSSYQRETKSYEDLTGLGRRHPAIALAFSIFLLSLAGFPPFGGFFGRLYLFQTAIEAELTVLVVIAILNSLVSAYCYLKVIFYMYMREPSPSAPQAVPMRAPALTWVLVLAAMLVLWSGVLPRPFVAIATAATFVK
jgi:NADH-quinone oxidoreductase subunit N